MKHSKIKKIMIALLMSIFATAIFDLVLPNSKGIISNIFVVAIISHFFFSILAILTFIFRISGFIRRESNIYILLIATNVWLGVLEFILYSLGRVNLFAIEIAIPNLFIGALLTFDLFKWIPSKKQLP